MEGQKVLREPQPLYQETAGQLTELPVELLARAVRLGAGAAGAALEKAPEQSGAFSFCDDLRASTGDPLPDVESQLNERVRWQAAATPLGYLVANTEVSTTTGCMSVLKAWRDPKGYAYERDPEAYGLPKSLRGKMGIRLHKLAYILHKRKDDPDYVLPEGTPIDHICRFTGCCNPHHISETTTLENNRLQRKARAIEAALAAGQLMLGPTGYKWLDNRAALSKTEDTGIIVNTRFGPYRILKVEDDPLIVRGEPEPDDLLLKVRPPSKSKYIRPSRAKKAPYIAGQLDLAA